VTRIIRYRNIEWEMEEPKHHGLTLLLRRFKDEPLEVVRSNLNGTPASKSPFVPCKIFAREEGDTLIYTVVISADVVICPVDWGRFAYDGVKVRELVSRCVEDNLSLFVHDIWSGDVWEELEATLKLAIGDLAYVFDVNAVRLERGPDNGIHVFVEGIDKTRKRINYVFNASPP
jgi:hypothetical protein